MKRPLRLALMCLILAAGVTADQVAKRTAASSLPARGRVVLVPGFLDLSYTENNGVVFGIGDEDTIRSPWKNRLLAVMTTAGMLAVILLLPHFKKGPFFREAAVFLILSGAAGNLIDRIRYGHVVDFIHMHAGRVLDWPFLFNAADAFICVGAAIVAAGEVFGNRAKRGAQGEKRGAHSA